MEDAVVPASVARSELHIYCPVNEMLNYFIFPISIIYCELLLLGSTTGIGDARYVLYIALFSSCFGMLWTILTGLFGKTANRVLKSIILAITGIFYLAMYMVYVAFSVFYDLNTMVGGAGGAIIDFKYELFRIFLEPSTIIHMILFLVPFALYMVLGIKLDFDKAEKLEYKMAVALGLMALFFYYGQMVSVSYNDEDFAVATSAYSFQEAVPKFGFLKSMEYEIANLLKNKDGQDMVFETGEVKPKSEVEPEEKKVETKGDNEPSEESAEPPVVYEPNVLDIDFEKLAENAPSNLAALDMYVASLEPTMKNQYTGIFEGKNLIFITAESFTAEVIDEKRTPTLYRMATKGINFEDFYQPTLAGTTGGEYHNIFGMLATLGGKSLKNTSDHLNYMTMGNQLDMLGYTGAAFHNGNYDFYDRNITHNNLGYSDGFKGLGNGLEEMVNSKDRFSDVELFKGTLPVYEAKQPFNLYYMTYSGHSPYVSGNPFAKEHLEQLVDAPYCDFVKNYLATQMELEDAMTYVVQELEAKGILDDTVIVISADHFPYGLGNDGEGSSYKYIEELYGYQFGDDAFERDHNRLIIWSGCLEKDEPIVVSDPVCSIDILPTLLNLFGVEFDSRLLPGRDALSDSEPLVYSTSYFWKSDKGTYEKGTFIPLTEDTEITDNYVMDINKKVKDKLTFSKGVLSYDYYRHVFGKENE